MISPYVRRRRLATELVRLREEHGYSAERLCKETKIAKQKLSRLENARVRPDQDEIMRVLDHFRVGEKRWEEIMAIARESQENGWWENFRVEMGPRQALYADLEAGAEHIAEYHITLLPGLLQIPAYTEVRAVADRAAYPRRFTVERALEARAARQRVLDRPGGPTYEVIIDELAIRRHAAPPEVVRAQLDHLINVGHEKQKTTIRVLRLTARIAGNAVPRSSYFSYRYPDPSDPVVVAVDTITSDLVLTDPDEVANYASLYERLRSAALSPADSLDFLASVAEELPDYTRR
ncbi:Helix-turn-helix domain-containing protein [Micromonospora matsumotoense]|uniref:Helix-turn-helix domain-containing protein n=1 Tax=Micromonospora matsumotoense TaxID=121616 RepID=A0A1C4Y6V2_9ACTN|nr:helix-turn-helix transcriptional regulator [Micromonospora matsumotoense]SCF16380.1 Helix-turn-helix domain-containing protein [Micromonospora matsumotoense]